MLESFERIAVKLCGPKLAQRAAASHGKVSLIWGLVVAGVLLPDFARLVESADDVILARETIHVTAPALQSPVFATAAPGDPGALYVVEQFPARIHRVDLTSGAATAFLDLPDPAPAQGERGLKGLAFHPEFETNGKFYVHHYDGTNVNIREFKQSDDAVVDPETERLILSFTHKGVSDAHTAGWIGFSPIDNYLYIPTGDGGDDRPPCLECGLPAQDPDDLRGKVLRIDVDAEDQFPDDESRNYGIPSDNPYVVGGGGALEVFALGLRSPFRAGFDSATGDLYISDVGSLRFEEVNLLPAETSGGQNFGWRALEGSQDAPQFPDPHPADAIDPIFEYPWNGAAAVIGGTVYRGSAIPTLNGHYIYADFVQRTIGTFEPQDGAVGSFVDRTPELGSLSQVVSFAEDSAGEWYFIRRNTSALYKIVGFWRADFDRSSIVDADDLLHWQDSYGVNDDSDADSDGDSDGIDFLIWQYQYVPEATSTAPALPEPSSLWILLSGTAALQWRRWRRLGEVGRFDGRRSPRKTRGAII